MKRLISSTNLRSLCRVLALAGILLLGGKGKSWGQTYADTVRSGTTSGVVGSSSIVLSGNAITPSLVDSSRLTAGSTVGVFTAWIQLIFKTKVLPANTFTFIKYKSTGSLLGGDVKGLAYTTSTGSSDGTPQTASSFSQDVFSADGTKFLAVTNNHQFPIKNQFSFNNAKTNTNMRTFQQVKFLIALCLLMVAGISKINAAPVHDTVFVCNGTAVKMLQADSTGKTYRWFNSANAVVATTSAYVVSGTATGVTFTPANTPVVNVYKLVVDSSGGATCPSDTFYKVIISLPSYNTYVTTPSSFYCTGSIPANVVLTDSVVSTGSSTSAPNLTSVSSYASMGYAWAIVPGSPTPPSGTATTNTYSVPGASLITAGPGSYGYSVATSYTLASPFVLGTGASTVGSCTGSATGHITIAAPPAVTATNVTTSFQ